MYLDTFVGVLKYSLFSFQYSGRSGMQVRVASGCATGGVLGLRGECRISQVESLYVTIILFP